MNKFGIVLGVAAVVTLAGCKDPDYQHANPSPSQGAVKSVDTTPVETKPIVIEQTTPKCKCLPGAKHTSPCLCGDPDCKCIVETKPVVIVPPAPEQTVYTVQSGDSLSKISKKFNVTIAAIKRTNNLQGDMLRVGQKLKLPGKFDVSAPAETPKAAAAAPKKTVKKVTTVYNGATKDYVVKNGDTLGSVAYGNGINIRQLKALNGLTSDSLKVGQKLKVPAEKAVKAAAKPAAVEKKAEASVAPAVEKKAEASVAPAVEKAPEAPAPVVEEKKDESAPVPVAEAKKPAAPATATYVVQEGDDMTGVSIRWGVSAADIRELNNLGEGDQLVPGQIIKLPADAQQ